MSRQSDFDSDFDTLQGQIIDLRNEVAQLKDQVTTLQKQHDFEYDALQARINERFAQLQKEAKP